MKCFLEMPMVVKSTLHSGDQTGKIAAEKSTGWMLSAIPPIRSIQRLRKFFDQRKGEVKHTVPVLCVQAPASDVPS